MVCIRPNLLQAISIVTRNMHDPGRGHREVVKWILWCVKGTIDVGLIFEKQTNVKKVYRVC